MKKKVFDKIGEKIIIWRRSLNVHNNTHLLKLSIFRGLIEDVTVIVCVEKYMLFLL